MSEWLTTGEMIDRLKVGEVAYNEEDVMYVTKNENGSINHCDKNGIEQPLKGFLGIAILNRFFVNSKWRILPQYCTFEEAMKAYEEGKKVYFCGNEFEVEPILLPSPYLKLSSSKIADYGMKNIYRGKWQIIE